MKITHLVFKKSDVDKACNAAEAISLADISHAIKNYRFKTGRIPEPRYIVINMDEPYIDEIIATLERHGHWG